MAIMLTWSARTYLAITGVLTLSLSMLSFEGIIDSVSVLGKLSDHIIVFSIALVVFPTVAVPLMLQIITYTKKYVGEVPTRGLYRDFNVACLTVSIGAVTEIIVIFLISILENRVVDIILASFALSNLIAFTLMFILIMLLLHKIIIELELFLSK